MSSSRLLLTLAVIVCVLLLCSASLIEAKQQRHHKLRHHRAKAGAPALKSHPHKQHLHAARHHDAFKATTPSTSATWSFMAKAPNITGGGPGSCAYWTPTTLKLSFPTGQCISSPLGLGSSQYFCDEEYSYELTYTDVACQNLVSVSRATYECQTYNDNDGDAATMQYSCINPSAGPAMPIAFPPAESTITSSCVNNGPNGGYVCEGSEGAICTDVAILDNVCHQPLDLQSALAGNSSISSCTGAYGAVAYYRDRECQELITVQYTPVGCNANQEFNSGVVCYNGTNSHHGH